MLVQMADSRVNARTIVALSWNTLHGSATTRAVELADRVGADVLMLQEARPPTAWGGLFVGGRVPKQGYSWGSWIAVRSGRLKTIKIDGYAGWVAGAVWQRQRGSPLALFSVHSPTRRKNEGPNAYVEDARRIVVAICDALSPGTPLIIGGDFNFKSLGERLATEAIRNRRDEQEALRDFRMRGLMVAWRDLHEDKPLPQTLRWSGDRSVPYHCDGFLLRGLPRETVSCELIDVERHSSDHSPVLLCIGPERPKKCPCQRKT
jgi:endonuclease/exonuclease/phosphatase family metal-dependent hydrolase